MGYSKVVELACSRCVMPKNYARLSVSEVNGRPVCGFCLNHQEKEFEGERGLIKNLNLGADERVGVTVSGGKDSLYAWMVLVDILGPEKVIAFNHHKTGLVHPIAEKNIAEASRILGSEVIVVKDDSFQPRFCKNLEAFLNKPDAAMIKVVLCSGCRYGIRGQMFLEGLNFGVSKFVNANSYLEQNPFKIALLENKGDGSYAKGVIKGLNENSGYWHGDNIEVIKRDHEYWPSGKIFSDMPEFYNRVQQIHFDKYFTSDPAICKQVVKKRLNWQSPERSWHFDCQVESFKDVLYYGLLGHTEVESKWSAMIRHSLISREVALERLHSYRKKVRFVMNEVDHLCKELDITHLLSAINDFCKSSQFIAE